jgi:hypothetical protein
MLVERMVHAVRLGSEDEQEKRAGGEKRPAARGFEAEAAHAKNGRIKDPSLSIREKKSAAAFRAFGNSKGPGAHERGRSSDFNSPRDFFLGRKPAAMLHV